MTDSSFLFSIFESADNKRMQSLCGINVNVSPESRPQSLTHLIGKETIYVEPPVSCIFLCSYFITTHPVIQLVSIYFVGIHKDSGFTIY